MSSPPLPSSQIEETIVVTHPTAAGDNSHPSHGPVDIIVGAAPQLDSETQKLLRTRLRAAALVLLVAIASFFVRDLFIPDAPLFWFRAGTGATFCVVLFVLSSRIPLTLTQLRMIETGVFTLISLYLGVYQYKLVMSKVRAGNPIFELAAIKSCILYFFGAILLYGTFIPNTWQRAARVVVPMALVSFVVLVLLRLRSEAVEQFAHKVANFEQISDHVIMMTLAVAGSLYGTHIINRLRVEAFQARQMGQYHLKELLGTGGMGEVYLAEHGWLKRPCAIKLIRPDSQTDPLALSRFEREVRTTAQLTHRNTISIFDYGRTEDGTFYYVMEYLPGLSLADLVRRHGALPAARVIHLIRQTCGALREAHAAGLIHRDIKPANIFVARLGGVCDVAKLLDFGLVKHTAERQNVQHTHDQVLSGSPLYMSPEQAVAGQAPNARSDIYSLGATAYFALTGRAPFEGTNPIKVLIAHARDAVVPPSRVRPDVPHDIETVILRCLAKRPESRFASVVELDQALAMCAAANGWNDQLAEAWWRGAGLLPGGKIDAPAGEQHEPIVARAAV